MFGPCALDDSHCPDMSYPFVERSNCAPWDGTSMRIEPSTVPSSLRAHTFLTRAASSTPNRSMTG